MNDDEHKAGIAFYEAILEETITLVLASLPDEQDRHDLIDCLKERADTYAHEHARPVVGDPILREGQINPPAHGVSLNDAKDSVSRLLERLRDWSPPSP